MDFKTLISTAQTHVDQQQWQEAVQVYQQLVDTWPEQPDLHHLHAMVLYELKRYSDALTAVEKALAIGPVKTAYLQNQADVLCALGRYSDALAVYEKVRQQEPDNVDVLLNMGNVCHTVEDTRRAVEYYEQILHLAPDSPMALNNMGKIFYDQGDIDSALKYYNNALDYAPDYAEARFNRAVALLTQGKYAKAWPDYEWRFHRKDAQQVYPHQLSGRRWDGSPFGGERLLIHCEQGLGDVIQFCRYLPMVKALGGKIILEVQAALAPLLQNLPSVDETVIFDPQRPPATRYDRHVPLASLPMLMKTTLENIPSHVPYIQADGDKFGQWQKRLTAGGLRVGIVWSGSDVDPKRACRLSQWQPWWHSSRIHFYSLQKGPGAEQLSALSDDLPITHLGGQLQDFSDTAAIIANLDLVISVDTATAHLAGAMGKPVWVLLPVVPDWRWFRDRPDTPWYPTARLFRQTRHRDWSNVVKEIKQSLDELTASYGSNGSRETAKKDLTTRSADHAHAMAHYNKGLELMNDDDPVSAVKAFQQAITIRPKWAEAYFELGCAYHGQNLLKQAIDAYRTAGRLTPDMKPVHANLGLAYYQSGELELAATSYNQAIELHYDLAVVFNNLGVVREAQGDMQAAIDCYRCALRISPDYADALFNLGNTHLSCRDLDQALVCYTQAVQSDPGHAKAHGNLGRTYHLMGLLDQAGECYNNALRIKPDYPEAHLNRAICKLLTGHWEQGWKEYEWRFLCEERHRYYPHQLYGERWNGDPFAGRTLLVHSEQGIGDAIQFVRYLPMVKEKGGRVIFEARRSLMTLFEKLQGVDELIELSADKPPGQHYDMYIPLSSLPGLFNTTPGNVPNTVPYLKPNPAKVAQWKERLPAGGLNVGLVWSGNDTYKERTVTLADMSPLAFVQGINWIGLQKGPAASQARTDHLPYNFKVDNWGEEFEDFSDTAGAVQCLDLIITIDTAVAHLAGALGKDVWILLPAIPDWRWLLERSHTPWYPTAHLFRQFREGGWSRIMAHMSASLERWRLKNGR